MKVRNNHFSSNGGPTINAIEEVSDYKWIRNVKEVKTSLTKFHARLVEFGLIKERHDECIECSTQLEGCLIVKINIQYLMDQGFIQISRAKKSRKVFVIEPHFDLPTHVEIEYQRIDNDQSRSN